MDKNKRIIIICIVVSIAVLIGVIVFLLNFAPQFLMIEPHTAMDDVKNMPYYGDDYEIYRKPVNPNETPKISNEKLTCGNATGQLYLIHRL